MYRTLQPFLFRMMGEGHYLRVGDSAASFSFFLVGESAKGRGAAPSPVPLRQPLEQTRARLYSARDGSSVAESVCVFFFYFFFPKDRGKKAWTEGKPIRANRLRFTHRTEKRRRGHSCPLQPVSEEGREEKGGKGEQNHLRSPLPHAASALVCRRL
jgi:hypothetical protein